MEPRSTCFGPLQIPENSRKRPAKRREIVTAATLTRRSTCRAQVLLEYVESGSEDRLFHFVGQLRFGRCAERPACNSNRARSRIHFGRCEPKRAAAWASARRSIKRTISVEVPANQPIRFELVDAKGELIGAERIWVWTVDATRRTARLHELLRGQGGGTGKSLAIDAETVRYADASWRD